MTDIIALSSTSTSPLVPLFMNSNNSQSVSNQNKNSNNQRRNNRNKPANNDHKYPAAELGEQSSSDTTQLNPKAKEFAPRTENESDKAHSGGNSTRPGRSNKHHRIDDTNSISEGNASFSTPASIPSSSGSGTRQNNHRRKGKSTDRPDSSAPNNTTGNSRRQRNQRKDIAGKTFPSTVTFDTSKPNTSGTHTTQSQSNRRTAPRTSALKFIRKVEEDRDLLESLSVGLTNSTYECMVCWDVVRPAHKIWNCQVCWAAFHLDCLSTWAKKSSEDSNQSSGWRCPGCQNTQVTIPSDYTCFCGKTHEPVFNRYFTPHSCGELCGRTRNCSHPCNIPCHPGPCPPCGGLGPVQSCHCGNETFQARCAEMDSSSSKGRSCNQVCGELLGCGKHMCESACHPGLCQPCDEEQMQLCYCGKHERNARCGEGEPKSTIVDGETKIGYYDCMKICNRPLACGHHKCSKTCHALDTELGECPARPEIVKSCPCGSKSIEELLLGKERTSCLDPIPVCGGVCKKYLKCEHRCMQKCHPGNCSPCKMVVTVDCRCGSTHVQRICSEMVFGDKEPTCQKSCLGLRSCGKHQCTTKCCPAKNQPKSAKPLTSSSALDTHACTLICGKKLQCGVHTCQMLCHKGHCNPCLNASFDELSCSCGRTVLYPPIACGVSIPKCKYTCTRERDCGHVSLTSHPCHPDSEPCPPCTLFVAKQCMCQKTTMPSVPCYTTHPSCGKTCGRVLPCGQHKCIKSCHSGACVSSSSDVCSQSCAKTRKSCGHKCKTSCHGQEPCPEERPCSTLVVSSCKCGNITKEVACGSSTENPLDGKSRIIKCNDFCLFAERNRRVALALDIDVAARGPRIPQYDDYVLEYASANFEFTLKVEKKLAEWVADSSAQTLNLPPMKGHHRKFVHELAAHYNVTSESVDVEPYRSVVIHKKLNTSVPDLLASQACRQKRQVASTWGGGVEQLRKSNIKDPINAIYLHDIVTGLTRLELSLQLSPIFGNIKYTVRWLTDDDAVLAPQPGNMTMDELEILLVRLRTGIKALTINGQICERVELCWMNKDGEVVNHTNMNQSKRYFSAAQGDQLIKKVAPPKTRNAFSLLDEDEKTAAAKKAEEERIIKAKEAAGTLSLEAWDESGSGLTFPKTSRSSSPISISASSLRLNITSKATTVEQNVVDDWQDFIDSNDE